MEFRQALDWLYSVQQFGIKPGLDNTRRLLRELQLPGTRQRFIHVAGTNGKGSTCAFLESILRTGGERTALFTSPHLIHFRERIQVSGRLIPEEEIALGLTTLRDLVRSWQPHPTFFELALALALDWFDRAGAEIVVLETGMGGRLDSTNAVKPVVSVITPIDMDHQQWLGNTLAQIAAEKAGIIKPGVPVVSSPQKPEVAAVLKAAAESAGSPICFVEAPITDFPLPLPGPHQQWNAALAIAALEACGCLPGDPAVIRHGLANTSWPARFQSLRGGRLIVDGAHNPHSISALVETWQHRFGAEKASLIFGMVEGKEPESCLARLAPIVSEARFLTINSPRAIPACQLAEAWKRIAPSLPCLLPENLPAALNSAENGPRQLLCGSLYLCGEALSLLGNHPFEPSTQ